MNAYETATRLGLTGDNKEIVAQLQPLTAVDLPTKVLEQWLFGTGLLMYTGDKFEGPIQDALNGLHDEHPIHHAITRMKAAVYGDVTDMIRTATVPSIAGDMLMLATAMAAGQPDPAAFMGSLYGLVGGRPFADLTAEQYATARTEYEASTAAADAAAKLQQAWAMMLNEIINPVLADRGKLVEALRKSADTLEAG